MSGRRAAGRRHHAATAARPATTGGELEAARPRRGGGEQPFAATARWLRGRILDRLLDGSGWVELAAPMGSHDRAAIEAALGDLAVEGLVERHGTELLRAR